MDRRRFLKSVGLTVGVLGSPAALAACASGNGDGAVPAAIPDAPPTYNVFRASIETLAGHDRRFAFGVSTIDNVPVKDVDFEVWVRDMDGEVLGGPYPTRFFDAGGPALGVYLTRIDLPEPGDVEVVAVGPDGHGVAAIRAIRPEDSPLPVPGGEAIAVQTPTVADDMGLAELCTRQPDCGMHERSLDAALDEGRPVVLIFATPAYCQTAVCAPAVSTLDEVRESRDWGDVEFVHVEIFRDQGQTVTRPVQEWNLPSEPWLFTIAGDGTVVDRIDGPMVHEELTELVEALTSS